MARSMVGELESPPEWLRSRPGMVRATRRDLETPFQPTMMLTREPVITLRDENPSGCGCLVNNEDGGHFDGGVILNPNQGSVEVDGQESRVALLYENLMYVGVPTRWLAEEAELPRIEVGMAQSMWWVRSTLEPGWYDNQGNSVNYEFNPQWLDDGVEIMPTRVANGTRLLGRMARRSNIDRRAEVIGPPLLNDRGEPGVERWLIDTFIVPVAGHRPGLPPEVPPQWVDPMADMTHEQKVTRLNERFSNLTQATISLAKDEDWCSNYEDASESMGLAEEDYKRSSPEPTTYEVTVRLTYSVGPNTLDGVLYDNFGGSHDVRDSVDVESRVNITVTQEDGEDFDEDNHDIDEILESAGYSGYDDSEVDTWRTV